MKWRIVSCAFVIYPAVTSLFILMQYYVIITRFWKVLAFKWKRTGDSLACEIFVNVGLPTLSDALSKVNP